MSVVDRHASHLEQIGFHEYRRSDRQWARKKSNRGAALYFPLPETKEVSCSTLDGRSLLRACSPSPSPCSRRRRRRAPGAPTKTTEEKPKTFSDLFEGLEFRNIGPFRGGRVTAVTGVRHDPLTFYFGATGGGVWKTTDGGSNWEAVSDKDFKTGSVGAIAVSESDPNVVYVGMGEAPIRGNVSHGDGVYKSTDGGRRGRTMGLKETRQIARVRIHPSDPDLVYVAAQGHVWGPNPERGIYRSKDGGKTWTKVLYVDDRTGASDLAMDPDEPAHLYAGFWQVVRQPWELVDGGPGSALYRSTDGGDTWKKIQADGLPAGIWGKVGVAASAARPGRVYAFIEAKKGGGLFVSDDRGEKWKHVNDEHKIRERAWYYSWVYPDPKNADTVYLPNVHMHKSTDGGKTFSNLPVAARRQPRPLDRPGRLQPDDPRQRRRRDDHLQRRQDLVDAEQPADGAVLPRRRRTTGSPTGCTARSRTTRTSASRAACRAPRSTWRTGIRPAAARAAGSRRTRRTPTSSTRASTAARSRGTTTGRGRRARSWRGRSSPTGTRRGT